MSFRLMLQTDLIMLAPLGESVTAAFAIPMRIMWIDMVVALALVPVASVYVSSISDSEGKRRAISGILGAALYLSAFLVIVGLLVYPVLIHSFIKDVSVAKLSWTAVFWLTVSIPIRLNVTLTQMFLYSMQKGKAVIFINILALGVNFLLNWLFIYGFNMGFEGAYISTVLVSCLRCLFGLLIIRKQIILVYVFMNGLKRLKNIFPMMSAELFRLTASSLMWFAGISLFASHLSNLNRLTAFSVIIEFYFFALMPLVALMRTTAIYLSQESEIKTTIVYKYEVISKIAYKGLFVILSIIIVLWLMSDLIGKNLYHLDGKALAWWNVGIKILAVTFLLNYWNSFQKGIWQSLKAFKMIAILETIAYWMLFIPGIYFGLTYDNPYFPWVGMFLAELFSATYLWFYRYTAAFKKSVLYQSNLEMSSSSSHFKF